MRSEDIRELTRREPFQPFRIQITGAQSYKIPYPDQGLVLRSRMIIGVGDGDIPNRTEHVALVYVVCIASIG